MERQEDGRWIAYRWVKLAGIAVTIWFALEFLIFIPRQIRGALLTDPMAGEAGYATGMMIGAYVANFLFWLAIMAVIMVIAWLVKPSGPA